MAPKRTRAVVEDGAADDGQKKRPARKPANSAESKEHANKMARFRYQLSNDKTNIRQAYKDMTAGCKKDFCKEWQKTKKFDYGLIFKKEGSTDHQRAQDLGDFMTEDGILRAEGWTEQNQKTEMGIRARARTDCIMNACKKIKGHTKIHPQHGETLYRRLSLSAPQFD